MYNSAIVMIVYTDGSRAYGALPPSRVDVYCSRKSRLPEVDRVVLDSYHALGAFFCHTYRDGEIAQSVYRSTPELLEYLSR